MLFHPTELSGAFVIESEPHTDERGSFARTFCRREFAAHGLVTDFVQCSLSQNHRRGTLRGLHFQRAPHAETKLVRCVTGAIFDVIVDLRPDSLTFRRHVAVELSSDNGRSLYIPAGFAHGFQALTDDATVYYQISDFYVPELSGGVRWDDPAFGIAWPFPPAMLSEKDRALPTLAGLNLSPTSVHSPSNGSVTGH